MSLPTAFPIVASRPEVELVEEGMSLRDYFAAHALSLVTRSGVYRESDEIAHFAYTLADAMLKERTK